MKKILILSIFLGSSLLTFAENGIQFFKGSWAAVQAEAQKQHKLIFVEVFTNWSKPCQTMAENVFSDKNVGEEFNQKFINFQLDAEADEGISLVQKYVVDAFPTYLFVNENGELIHRNAGAMTAERFIAEAEKALKSAKNYQSLAVLDAKYAAGERNPAFLYDYLQRKILVGGDNSATLEEYLKAISESEYQTEKVLTVISGSVNSINSKGFEILLNANRRLGMTPKQSRAVMIGIAKVERKEIRKAMETKDAALLERTIQVARQTAFNPNNSDAEEQQIRMQFAKATNNFAAFQQLAKPFAEYLMSKTKEQLQAETERGISIAKKNAQARQMDTTSQQYQAMLFGMKDGAIRATSFQLNDLAWNYGQMTDDKNAFEEAIKWSERAIELSETAAYLDTYAQLLFKVGHQKEAIKKEKAAIQLAKKSGEDLADFEENLKKMKDFR